MTCFSELGSVFEIYSKTSQPPVGHHGPFGVYIGEFRKIEDFKHFVTANFMAKSIIEIENRFLAAPF